METMRLEITDFEEMRQQLNLLNEKLNKQSIINEKLIRRTMRDKIQVLGRDALVQCAAAIIATPLCISMFKIQGMSLPFCIVTALFLIGAVIYTYWIHKGLKSKDLLTGDLIQASQRIHRYKQLKVRWLRFSIPFIIVWLGWMFAEVYRMSSETEYIGFLCGGMFGMLLGGLWGTHFYRRDQRISSEVLQQIEELTKEA